MAYTVEFAPAADRQFAKLAKQIQTRIFAAIEALRENPRPRGCMKMSGPQGYYRIRIGDHRVIYQIADERLTVLVLKIADRKEVYRGY